ncbi:MAG TPA: glycosyltransferase [Pseudorhodoplanes sp.]|nr:glycosyltransferase [Pseudorhodoplanes sp.]
MPKTIVVFDHLTPMPDHDSGSNSIFEVLRSLRAIGHEVCFVPANLEYAGRYTDGLRAIGIEVLHAPQWTTLQQVISERIPRADLVMAYRGPIAGHIVPFARKIRPDLPVIFMPVDLHFLRMQRQAEIEHNKNLAGRALEMARVELTLVRNADMTIVVSPHEMELLAKFVPAAQVRVVPIMRPPPAVPRVPFDERRDVVFIGGFRHPPNIDAVLWFVNRIWPRLAANGFPGKFVIAGSDMPPEIASIARPGIEARGFVPDIAPLFQESRISVAPLRYGAGIKGKIVSSLSYGVPVVATSIAAEGMGLRHDFDALISDDPSEFARLVAAAYIDPALWNRLSEQSINTFATRFSSDIGRGRIQIAVDEVFFRRGIK